MNATVARCPNVTVEAFSPAQSNIDKNDPTKKRQTIYLKSSLFYINKYYSISFCVRLLVTKTVSIQNLTSVLVLSTLQFSSVDSLMQIIFLFEQLQQPTHKNQRCNNSFTNFIVSLFLRQQFTMQVSTQLFYSSWIHHILHLIF